MSSCVLAEVFPATSELRCTLLAEARTLDAELAKFKHAFEALKTATAGMEIVSVLKVNRGDWDIPPTTPEMIFNHVCQRVEQALSSSSIPLQLDARPVRERFFRANSWNAMAKVHPNFGAESVMAAMLDEFEASAEVIQAKQVADAVYKMLIKHTEPRVVTGRTVLTQYACVEGSGHAAPVFTYQTRERVREALSLLSAILPLVDLTVSRQDAEAWSCAALQDFTEAKWHSTREFRAHMGVIEIRVYHKKIEYYLPASLADALNLFVSIHTDLDGHS